MREIVLRMLLKMNGNLIFYCGTWVEFVEKCIQWVFIYRPISDDLVKFMLKLHIQQFVFLWTKKKWISFGWNHTVMWNSIEWTADYIILCLIFQFSLTLMTNQ